MSNATQGEAKQVSLEINGQVVQASQDETILEAARRAGIDVPTLCEYSNLSNVGGCRMCLVEIDGDRLETACTTSVSDGMSVEVDTDDLWNHRRTLLELMFAEENHYCMYCEMEGDCELEDLFNEAGMDEVRFPLEYEHREADLSNEYIALDRDRCILCGRCIRTCDEIVGNKTLNFSNRGRETEIVADNDVPLGDSSCVSCGSCAQVCPTGALYDTFSAYKGRQRNLETVTSTCTECSVGCEIEVHTNSGRIVRIDGANIDGPDGGQLCEKGRFGLLWDDRPRVRSPAVRNGAGMEEVSVEDALGRVRELLAEAGTVNAVASGRLPTETLESFAEAMEEYGAALEVPGAERAAFEAELVEELAEYLSKDPADLRLEAAADLMEMDTIVLYDTGIVESNPVVASYVRRAAKNGTTLLTVDDERDDMERFADVSLALGSGMAQATETLSASLEEESPAEAADGTTLEDVAAGLETGSAAFVVGPDVDDQDALFDVFALAAATDNRVLSLNAAANQELPQFGVGPLADEADVAYIFAADDDGEALDRMIDVARAADVVVVQATRESMLTRAADVVLPALDWFERSGTTVDVEGSEKTVTRVLEPRGVLESDADVVEGLLEVKA